MSPKAASTPSVRLLFLMIRDRKRNYITVFVLIILVLYPILHGQWTRFTVAHDEMKDWGDRNFSLRIRKV